MEKPIKKSPEQSVKDHAREIFNQAVADFRSATMAKHLDPKIPKESLPPVLSESQYAAILHNFAERSVKAASVFRETWVRLKPSIFPADDK